MAARRRLRPALWIAVAVGLALALFVGVLATRRSAADRQTDSPLLGRPAPAVAGADLLGQGDVNLSAFRGRWVVVNFFATWCIPCRDEHPELGVFRRRNRSSAEVVSVVYADSSRAVRRFFAQEGGGWPVVSDPRGRVALDYGVRGVPESFLVEPRGYVVAKITGGVTAAGLERLMS